MSMLLIPTQSLRTTGLEDRKENRNSQVKFMIRKVSTSVLRYRYIRGR